MLKNLKHSVLIILIVIILFFISMPLLASKQFSNKITPVVRMENINKLEYRKWSGLGMGLFSTKNSSEFDEYVDILLVNGFTELRIGLPDYTDTTYIAQTKAAIVRAVAKGAKVIWGICSGQNLITAESWVNFRAAILDTAQWAQDNGVYEFLIGNEEEMKVDGTTMTVAQLIINLKEVATEVKQIFTNGNVAYSCWAIKIDEWIAAGKGNIDILASNIFMGGDGFYDNHWKTLINKLVNAFGSEGTYLTEFAPSYSSLDDYSEDEAMQAEAVNEMIEYIEASGITRALYFVWKCDDFGVMKDNGTYRFLWDHALLNSGSEKFTAVPTINTISLLNTIALVPK